MMEIVFCTDDNYIMPTGVLITSIEQTNKGTPVHYNVVSEKLTESSKKKLQNCLKNQTSSISFYSVDKNLLADCPVRTGDHITLATYFRILFPAIFPENVSKILYLDGDMLCLNSLKKLWETDISYFSAGVTIDIYASDIRRLNRLDLPLSYEYFNAGMMLINLDWWRKNNIQQKTLEYIYKNPDSCIAHDQDALNKTLCETVKYVSPEFNFQFDFWLEPEKLLVQKKHFNEITQSSKIPCILHFTGKEKPWHKECVYPLKNLWTFFKNQTEWKKNKKTHAYNLKSVLKHKLRTVCERIGLVQSQNQYRNIDVSELENDILNSIGKLMEKKIS